MRDRFRSYMTKQFGRPSGLLGTFIGNRMAKGNIYDALWTVSLLGIQPQQHVLEIGFGPGVSTQIASQCASQGFIAGIDHSETMVEAASKRNAASIQAGRMELKPGEVSALPYPDDAFDIAFSLHSIYFWPNPVDCLKEIRRVLKPGGLLGITIQPKDAWKQDVDSRVMTLYFGQDIVGMLIEAGFRDVKLKVPPPRDHKTLECILGVK